MDIEKLKQAKKDLNLTYKDISKLSGVPLRTIEDMLAGRTKPRIDTVEAVEKVLYIERTFNNEPKRTEDRQNKPIYNVLSGKKEENELSLSDSEKALILALRRSKKGEELIRAVLLMIGETRTIEEILKMA